MGDDSLFRRIGNIRKGSELVAIKEVRSAKKIAKALECFRLASDEKKHNCKQKTCPYNNNDPEYGCWCCGNNILGDAVMKLLQQDEKIKKLNRKIDRIWTGR